MSRMDRGKDLSFAKQLRQYRERAGMTQQHLAEQAGLTVNAIGALERGERLHPYPHTVQLLATALGLTVEERTAFLAAVPRRGSAPAPARVPVSDNLPEPLNALVGREQEVAVIRDLLQHTPERLITLTGLGGSGKTRLALEVAREMRGQFADGVWLVELGAVAEASLVPQTVALALGLREAAGASFSETLVGFLEGRSVLLVLDNCEHLIDACAWLAEHLLSACAGLRILATSREPLRIRGERQWPVPPLATPDPEQSVRPDELLHCPAVQLFVERARAVAPSFGVTSRNAALVAQTCVRLNGVPLAIELAAARVRVLTVEQIWERLDDCFQILTGGGRTAPPRQQTLEAALDWSYDLLSEVEQAVFRRLAVFAGGWSVEGAEAVCTDGGLGQPEVLDVLTRLVDKSLVVVEDRRHHARYRLLEPVRQYAQHRLVASGELAATRARHADYYRTLAERAESELTGPKQVAWLDRLEQEHDNLRAALHWLRERGDPEQNGLRLAVSLWRFWWLRSYFSEGRAQLTAMLALPRPTTPAVRARALHSLGELTFRHGKAAEARGFLEAALTLSGESADRRGIAAALRGLGRLALDQGEHATARLLLETGLRIERELDDRPGMAFTLTYLSWLALFRGDHAVAGALLTEGLALCQELADREGIGRQLLSLGHLALDQGDLVTARQQLAESVAIFAELDYKYALAYSLEGLAEVEAARTCFERSLQLAGAAAALRETTGAAAAHEFRARHERRLAVARAALGDAAAEAAWAAGRALLEGTSRGAGVAKVVDLAVGSAHRPDDRDRQP